MKMRTIAVAVTTSIALCVALACGEDVNTIGARSRTVSRSTLTEDLASAICSNVGSCCMGSGTTFNAGLCRTRVASESQSAIDHEGDARPFDAQEAASCLDAVAANARKCDLGKVYIGAMRCVKPHGKVGVPCEESCFERSSGFVCGPPQLPIVREGGAPSYVVDCYMSDFIYCDRLGVCAQQLDAGSACAVYDECMSESCENGVCKPLGLEGDNCFGGLMCDERHGLYCDSFSGTCKKLRPDGAACGSPEQCASGNCPWSGPVVVTAADAGPPKDHSTCAPPTGESTDPQYLAFVCGD
jgi:hypothetical protein